MIDGARQAQRDEASGLVVDEHLDYDSDGEPTAPVASEDQRAALR